VYRDAPAPLCVQTNVTFRIRPAAKLIKLEHDYCYVGFSKRIRFKPKIPRSKSRIRLIRVGIHIYIYTRVCACVYGNEIVTHGEKKKLRSIMTFTQENIDGRISVRAPVRPNYFPTRYASSVERFIYFFVILLFRRRLCDRNALAFRNRRKTY